MFTTLSTSDDKTARLDFAARMSGVFGRKPDREPQLREIDRLSALSDAELAQMGLRRGGIAGSVLGNRFCY
ncbi:hypothetical protein D2T29_04110 [Sinirhodobacter populi]|uniref:DUF1127 domain-containing protein n=1 Tax=Paenirhodobacter populi TaxID=2306993 RepID=A0A443KMS5_9RHOB|nr:hypothetical protein [Sinirhodobacter populi]RWR34091.1 hypothetical protein D2T29_04110 [Sinirhodobacter populi]